MIQTPDPNQSVDLFAAFDALVELDPVARTERLAAIGAADPAAGRALEEMLEADANSDSSLDRIDAIFGTAEPPSTADGTGDRDVLKLVGKSISHFRIVEPLAAGGMGVVYRAIDTQLGRAVALKFPLPGQHLDGQVRERFLREARAAAALDHSNICSIYETGQAGDGQLFFAMPFYDGETLKARIARDGSLPITDALDIAIQIARGLHAAHRAGIVHRDLKPANVMIVPDGGLKILDFGVARMGDVTLTKSHDTLGTVSYMAPEQVRGDQLDGRADLWALGVLLYEMLTGRRPFEGEHAVAIAHAIVHSNPVRPSALRSGISPGVDSLVLALLAREPRGRPASAEDVAAELTALQSQSPASSLRRWRPASIARERRRPMIWAAIAALVVAFVGGTAWLLRARPASGSAEPRIVAVLPFGNIGGRDDADHLAVGVSDEIAMQLSRLSAVTVPVEGSALKYRGSTKPTAAIASELGADAIVRGSVQRTGDEMRMQIEVFSAGEKRRVWTDEYRGPVNTVLGLQRSVTNAIVGALDVDLTSAERAALNHVPTTSAAAYDLYLRGRATQIGAASLDSSQRVASLQRAQSYYARARESDPKFAAPRAALATSHLALVQSDRISARRGQARLEAEAALRLQPGMSEAHEALAAYWSLQGDELHAVSELQRAVAGRPNASHLHSLLAASLRSVGRWDEAVIAFERASRLDPRNKRVHQAASLTYARMRRYDESIAHWDRTIALDSADPFPQIIRGNNYLRRGDVDSLDAAIRRIPLGLDGGGPTLSSKGMITYARYTAHRIKRRHAEALASLDSARYAISTDGLLYVPVSLMRAQTLERMGDVARARPAYEAARKLLEDSVAAHPRDARMHVALGLAYAGLQRRADAVREARTAAELVPLSTGVDASTAFLGGALEIYAQLGDADAALELIELLLTMPAGREVSVPLLRLDPNFDKLRNEPRFEALLARFSRN